MGKFAGSKVSQTPCHRSLSAYLVLKVSASPLSLVRSRLARSGDFLGVSVRLVAAIRLEAKGLILTPAVVPAGSDEEAEVVSISSRAVSYCSPSDETDEGSLLLALVAVLLSFADNRVQILAVK